MGGAVQRPAKPAAQSSGDVGEMLGKQLLGTSAVSKGWQIGVDLLSCPLAALLQVTELQGLPWCVSVAAWLCYASEDGQMAQKQPP